MKQILFLCSANRLRSVIAAQVFRSLLFQRDRDLAHQIRVSSAGVIAEECIECFHSRGLPGLSFGRSPASSAVAALAKRGIDVSGYLSQELDTAMVKEADLILAVLQVNKQGVLELCPQAKGKVFTLMEFTGEELYYLFHDCHNLAPELYHKPDFGNDPAITEALTVEAEKCLAKAMPKILDFLR